MFLAALFEFSFLTLIFWVFLLLLLFAVAFDRDGAEAPKWWVISVGFIGAAVYFWPDFTFFGASHVDAVVEGGKEIVKAHDRVVLWNVVNSSSFWIPVGSFLGIGLVYSMLEFGLMVRKTARTFSDHWQRFLKNTRAVPCYDSEGRVIELPNGDRGTRPATELVTYLDMLLRAKTDGGKYRFFQEAVDAVKEFVADHRNSEKVIQLAVAEDKLSVEPKVNRLALASFAGAWTFLWPAYAINLIIGDLLTEIFITFANVLASISARLVKTAFKDVFTLK